MASPYIPKLSPGGGKDKESRGLHMETGGGTDVKGYSPGKSNKTFIKSPTRDLQPKNYLRIRSM